MYNTLRLSLIFLIVFTLKGFAQQNSTQSEDVNGTKVSFTMDNRISDLLTKSEELCQRNNVTNPGANENAKSSDQPSVNVSEVCRQMPKLSGFKILVANVNDATDANNIRFEIRQSFPDLRTEVDSSLRPNYKILAGSFFSRQSGQADLKRVRTVWKDAQIVPYRIFCAESK